MTNDEMARSSLLRSRRILEEAEILLARSAWNLVVRRSQEAVELALKAILRVAGIEVPQVHDVGGFLKRYHNRLPGNIAEDMDRFVSISRRLGREREISFYGDEETGTPPEELYAQADAEDALQDARYVVDRCRDAFDNPEDAPAG